MNNNSLVFAAKFAHQNPLRHYLTRINWISINHIINLMVLYRTLKWHEPLSCSANKTQLEFSWTERERVRHIVSTESGQLSDD